MAPKRSHLASAVVAPLHPPADLGEALRLVAEGIASVTGDEFFRTLVRKVAEALHVDVAFVTEFPGTGNRVRILACWDRDRFGPSTEYDVDKTPCRDVIAGVFTHYAEHVQELFPEDRFIVERSIESFLGVPLRDRDDKDTLGHLAIMDSKPFATEARSLDILKIFAARARAELERMHFEQRLEESERRLASVLSSAMDAIVTIDGERRVTLCNQAAEKLFGCRREELVGQRFERFMSKRLREFFDAYLLDFGEPAGRRRQFWAPAGLSALRADGSEFAIEATLSPLDLGGASFFTFIIRDVNEREHARRMLKSLERERSYLRSEIRAAHGQLQLLGDSAVMRALSHQIERVAPTDSTVLISGETGTGKELIALSIHELSRRRERILVKLNCAALPRELVESELFGHEKGAFTGATQQKKGRFELAHNATLFLDEVAELAPETQAKLLRVLQEQEFERVGGTESIKVDVRVIAATNRNLGELVQKGQFRADLFYRLSIFPIQSPALREHLSDLPELATAFVRDLSASMGKNITGVSDASMARLMAYTWPGNVRELRNVIERATILCDGPLLEVSELQSSSPFAAPELGSGTLEEVERAYIRRVLEGTSWVIEGKRGAAGILGLHPNTLRARLAKLGLRRPERISDGA